MQLNSVATLLVSQSNSATPAFKVTDNALVPFDHATDGAMTGITGSSSWKLGNKADGSLGLTGQWFFHAWYSEQKTLLQMRTLLAKLFGTYNADGIFEITSVTGQRLGIDNTASTGNIDIMFNAPIVNIGGLRSVRGFTNTWAADSIALAGATDVGTPVIDNNGAAGPLFSYGNTNECDRMTTANVVALDGKKSAASMMTGSADNTNYDMSAYLMAGDAGVTTTKATLALITDGTFPDGGTAYYCPVTGLTNTATRYSCNAKVTGSPTFVKGEILVGTATPDVGSIFVCQAQSTKSQATEPPTMTNDAQGDVAYVTTAAANWPATGTSGYYEHIFAPLYSPCTRWNDATNVIYNLDVSKPAGGSHDVVVAFGYTAACLMLVAIRGPADEMADFQINNVDLTPLQPYAVKVAWRSLGAGKCNTYAMLDSCGTAPLRANYGTEALYTTAFRAYTDACDATTVIASDTTGTSICPGTPGLLTLGNRYDSSVPTSQITYEFRVGTVL